MGSNGAVDGSDVEAQVVPLEVAIEAGDLSEELAELSIGRVKIRDLVVEDVDDDDPQLLFRDEPADKPNARGRGHGRTRGRESFQGKRKNSRPAL